MHPPWTAGRARRLREPPVLVHTVGRLVRTRSTIRRAYSRLVLANPALDTLLVIVNHRRAFGPLLARRAVLALGIAEEAARALGGQALAGRAGSAPDMAVAVGARLDAIRARNVCRPEAAGARGCAGRAAATAAIVPVHTGRTGSLVVRC